MRRTTATVCSAAFFVLAPGVVAGVVPRWLAGWDGGPPQHGVARVLGLVLVVAGVVALIHTFVGFVIEGAGTPAPAAPTERLVVGGLYRHVRNPMYLAVLAIIIGQALALGRPVLLAYAAAVGAMMAAFVHWYEEPVLEDRFGAQYDAYRRAVPAWWPRLRPWRPEATGPAPGELAGCQPAGRRATGTSRRRHRG